MQSTDLTDLTTALSSDRPADVLAAAWDTFDVTGNLADSLTFGEVGDDEVQAMLTGIKCAEARALLPLPAFGSPLDTPAPGPGRAGLEPYAVLLRHAETALHRLAALPELADDAEPLTVVAERAGAAAHLLMTIRQDDEGAP